MVRAAAVWLHRLLGIGLQSALEQILLKLGYDAAVKDRMINRLRHDRQTLQRALLDHERGKLPSLTEQDVVLIGQRIADLEAKLEAQNQVGVPTEKRP